MFFLNCILVFILMFVTDVVWTVYFNFISQKLPKQAAISGVLIYLLSSCVTLKYVENVWYLIPAMLGAYFGTYFTVKYMK